MRYYSARIKLTAIICVLTMLFMTGCGAGRSQKEIADSVITTKDSEAEVIADDADVMTETQSAAETESGINQTEEKPETESELIQVEEKSETESGLDQAEEESDAGSVAQEEELITDPATLQAVLDIVEAAADQTVCEYADFTVEEFLAEVANVYRMAHDNGYVYGDSQTMPPCEDGYISCDRLIARTLWNLGMTDQTYKGMNIGVEAAYLTTHGFEIVTDQSQLRAGDIVMQDNGVSGRPNWKWHTFVLVSYDPETTMCEKYDTGHFTPDGKDRISSEQPFVCPLADYGIQRRFVCGFHLKEKPEE